MINTTTKESAPATKTRLSGIEAYRIIAIFLICLSHANPQGLNLVNPFLSNILVYIGQCGNIMFIICSSYFLVDSKKIKLVKVIKILLDSAFISIIILLGMTIAGYSFDSKTILMQIFPTFYYNMWFISIYIIFYLIHPLLNLIINNLSKKQHFSLCFALFVIYGLLGLFTGWEVGVNELLSFVILYFFVAYTKRYCQNLSNNTLKNTYLFIIFFCLFLALASLKLLIPLPKLTINQRYSPILLPMLLFLFNIFKNTKFKSTLINTFASCTLFIYCFHDNILLRTYIRPTFYAHAFSAYPDFYFGWIFVCGTGMFVLGGLVSLLYKFTLSKLSNYCAKRLSVVILDGIDLIYAKYFDNESTAIPKEAQENPDGPTNTSTH